MVKWRKVERRMKMMKSNKPKGSPTIQEQYREYGEKKALKTSPCVEEIKPKTQQQIIENRRTERSKRIEAVLNEIRDLLYDSD